VGQLSPRMKQVIGVGDRPTRRGTFGNQWGLSGVPVLLFDSAWSDRAPVCGGEWGGLRHWLLDGGPGPQEEVEVSGFVGVRAHWF